MAAERVVTVKLIGDPASASKAFREVGDSAQAAGVKIEGSHGILRKFAGGLGDVAKIAGGFVLGQGLLKAPELIGGLSDRARDLELQAKKAVTVFGDSLPVVQAWAKESASSLGLTKAEATNLAAGLQDLLVPMGMNREAAADLSTRTIGLAGALAEWSGGAKSSAEVADVLTKAYLGETDGLKALGIAISADEVKARMAAKAKADLGKEVKNLTEEEKKQLQALSIQELIFEKSTDAQAAFAEGSSSAARKQAQFHAAVGELKDAISIGLQPVIVAVSGFIAATFIPVLQQLAQEAGPAIGAAIDAIVPVLQQLGDVARVVAGWVREELIPAFVSFATEDVMPILEAVRDVFAAIAPHVKALASEIADRLRPHLEGLVQFVAEHREVLQALAIVVGGALVVAFGAWAVSAGAAAVATIAATAPVLAIGLALTALVAGIIYVVKHWDELTERYPKLEEASEKIRVTLEGFADFVREDLVPAVRSIAETVSEVVTAAVGAFQSNWPRIEAIVKPVMDQIVLYINTVWEVFSSIVLLIKALVTGDWSAAWKEAGDIVEAFKEFVVGSLENALAFAQGLISQMYDAAKYIGRAVVNGIKDGINEIWDDLVDWAKDKAGGLVDGLKDALKIWSPSRRTAEEIGQPMAEGIRAGFETKWAAFTDSSYRQIAGWVTGAQSVISKTWGSILEGSPVGGATVIAGGSPVLGVNASGGFTEGGGAYGGVPISPERAYANLVASGVPADEAAGITGYNPNTMSRAYSPVYGNQNYVYDPATNTWEHADVFAQRPTVINVTVNAEGYVTSIPQLANDVERELSSRFN